MAVDPMDLQPSGEVEESPSDAKSQEEGDRVVYASEWSPPLLRFDQPPRKLSHFSHQFRSSISADNNFLKGVKWSPDGSSFLTCSDDNSLRSFPSPDASHSTLEPDHQEDQDSYTSNLIIKEAETIYDYCWYPYMAASDPTTCVFASTTRDHPIHLWDATTGQLRCTYRAYDAMDEIAAALSVSFNSSGTKLFAGYNKCLRVFDVHRPGRDFEQYSFLKGDEGPAGILSSIAFCPARSGMLAVGSYSQTTALYAEDNMELLYVLHGQVGGATQVMFSRDGNYLFTGGRKDPYILCWDIRNTVSLVYKLYRPSENTNQRISFDLEPYGSHLGTGGEDGLVHIYDVQTGQWIVAFQAARDTINGFSFHPFFPLAATSSGHRRFSLPDDCEEGLNLSHDENCASVWAFHCSTEVQNAASDYHEASISQIQDTDQPQENH